VKVYDRHTTLRVLRGTLLATAAFTMLMVLGSWVRMMGRGLVSSEFLELLVWIVLGGAVLTVPLGLVVGVSHVAGRLKARGELTALEAAGVPWRRAFRGTLLVACLLSALIALAQERLMPWATREQLEGLRSRLGQLLRLTDGRDRVVELQVEMSKVTGRGGASREKMSLILYCARYSGGRMRNILFYGGSGGVTIEGSAAEGLLQVESGMRAAYLALHDARIHIRGRKTYDLVACEEYVICFPLRESVKERPEYVSVDRIMELLRRYETEAASASGWRREKLKRRRSQALAEIGKRAAMALSPIVLFFLVLPVAFAFARGGVFWSLAVAVLLYYMPVFGGTALARRGSDFALWLPLCGPVVAAAAAPVFWRLWRRRLS